MFALSFIIGILIILLGIALYFCIQNKTYKPLRIFMFVLSILCVVITALSAMLGMIFLLVAPIGIISCVYYLILGLSSRLLAKENFSYDKITLLTVALFVPLLLIFIAEPLAYLFFGALDMK
ncbi:MAG: hypothetical protein KGV44_12005 [Flavobacteriaceae bacterium]|nr:hypothetical protein [Flavobacteriaceae bacterium]